MAGEPQSGGAFSLRIPDRDREDWGDLPETHIDVFRYLVLWSGREHERPLTSRQIGKAVDLHEHIVVQALIELDRRGFIEMEFKGHVGERTDGDTPINMQWQTKAAAKDRVQ